MRILITGAAGFIGFHLARKLSKDHDVHGWDAIKGLHTSIKYERWARLKISKSIMDLCVSSNILKGSLGLDSFDVIIHLAAIPGVRDTEKNHVTYTENNINAFQNLISAASTLDKQPRFIYASSSSVYGDVQVPFQEDIIGNPNSYYGSTKRHNEMSAFCFSKQYGIKTTGIRFFSAYGPWGRPDMALWLFTKGILKGEVINVARPSENGLNRIQRDWTHIFDIVDAIKKLIQTEQEEDYQILNLGRGEPIDLNDFLKGLEKGLNTKANINWIGLKKEEVLVTWADMSKTEKLLDWKPKVNFDDGLNHWIDWVTDNEKLIISS